MSLAALFDDFPLSVCNRHLGRRRPRRPLTSILGLLDNDEVDKKVGQVFRQLPAILLELSDQESWTENGKNRKRKLANEKSSNTPYEPKSKVRVTTDDKFQVTLDTSNYQPDEIMVKVVDDKLAISAKHETKRDDVYEFHEMYRCFDLPEGVDPNMVTSKLSANGQLTIEAPMVKPKELTNERVIPIEMPEDHISSENGEKDVRIETSEE